MSYECRICESKLERVFVDLGTAPPSNAYLTSEQLEKPEVYYPLKVFVCDACKLVQLPEHASAESIFSDDYLYFSSYSASWVEHARKYAADMVGDLSPSFVVEIASNDGYLLKHFIERGVRVLGVEPAKNVAAVAEAKGIPTLCEFFGAETARVIAREYGQADLICGANVLAHVPNLHDFIEGMRILLAPGGTITMEFPHLLRLIEHCQFDTIYHEHFSYFSLEPLILAFASHGLAIYHVDELPTHGGSLRIYVKHRAPDRSPKEELSREAESLLLREAASGIYNLASSCWQEFTERVELQKRKLLGFLANSKALGLRGAGFGAPAKANTLLNYAGIKPDLLPFVVDDNPFKQGRFMPGSRIPIKDSIALAQAAMEGLDWVLVLPWNLYDDLRPKVRQIVGSYTRIVNPVFLGA
jgi:SAM-dependent methyltransferase